MNSRSDESATEEFRGLILRLRGRTHMSQAQLAARAGVHHRSIQAWESGVSYPSGDRLQALIQAFLETGAFGRGRERIEAEALWSAVSRESSRQRASFDDV